MLLYNSRNGETSAKLTYLALEVLEIDFFSSVFDGLKDEDGKGIHVRFLHATGGDCGGADAETRRIHGLTWIIGEHVLICSDIHAIEDLF